MVAGSGNSLAVRHTSATPLPPMPSQLGSKMGGRASGLQLSIKRCVVENTCCFLLSAFVRKGDCDDARLQLSSKCTCALLLSSVESSCNCYNTQPLGSAPSDGVCAANADSYCCCRMGSMPVERPWSDDRAFLGWADGAGAYVIANKLQASTHLCCFVPPSCPVLLCKPASRVQGQLLVFKLSSSPGQGRLHLPDAASSQAMPVPAS